MHDQATYELIERYLNGESSPEEVALVDKRLQDEPAFAALLALHRELDATLADADALTFARDLAAADAAYHAGTQASGTDAEASVKPLARRPFAWQRWAVAASIALLAVVGGYFLLRDSSLRPGEAYDRYFTVYDAPANFRSDSAGIQALYTEAFAAYNRQEWEVAIMVFTRLANADSNQVTARFYAAVSLLADGEPARAIDAFQKIAATQNPFTTQSKWYLALAWLKQGDAATAKDLLQSIAGGPEGKYQRQARELLDQLGD